MTTFFIRRSVEKAFQLDEQPSGLTLNFHKPLRADPPIITSAVDDIMYIVNKILQQSLATSQIHVVGSVVPTLSRVLGSDFIGMTQRKMRDEYYPRPVQGGHQPPEHTLITFMVLINNLDMAVDYIRRIVQNNSGLEVNNIKDDHHNHHTVEETEHLRALFPVSGEAAEATQVLQTLQTSFESKVNDLLSDGIQVLFNNVIKHRLRPILADAFRDIEYQPRTAMDATTTTSTTATDEMMINDEGSAEMVRPRFANAWTELIGPIARILTASAFDRLLTVSLVYLARLLEKRLWSYHGRVNVLGATRLERDVSGLVGAAVDVISSSGGGAGRYRHREAFVRCLQIVLVMGMEDDEWEEVLRGGEEMEEVVDKLSRDEKIRARSLVVRGRQ